MSSLARRYGAIREIAAYCGTSGDPDVVLRQVLSAAMSVLPGASLELVVVEADGEHRFIRPETAADGGAGTGILSDQLVGSILDGMDSEGAEFSDADLAQPAWVIPLRADSSTIGTLVCAGEDLPKADKDFLDTAAGHITLYLLANRGPSARTASDHAEKRIEEVSAIYEISQAFDNVPIDDLLRLITEKAAQVMDAQACSLMLKDPQLDELIIKASWGLSDEVVGEARVSFGQGVAGTVASTGEPMLLTDIGVDPRFEQYDVTPRPEIASSICVPLRNEEGLVQGVLSIRRISPAAMFTEGDVELFSVFASQAALAISNAHLYSSLQERIQELSTLYEASRQLSGAYSLDDASQALVRVAVDMAGDVSAILVLLDIRQGGTVQAASGVSSEVRSAVTDSIDAGAAVWMRGLRGSLSITLDDGRRWPAGMRSLAEALRRTFTWINMVPLLAEDSVLGVLILGSSGNKLPEQRRIRLLTIVASQAATIIKNAGRYEERMDRKVLELSALYQLSERISTAGNLREALDSILDIVRDTVWYDDSFISTVDYERGVMTVQACRGKMARRLQGEEFTFDEDSLSSWAIKERKALLSPDISRDPRYRSASTGVRGKGVRSLMAIPLIVHDEVVGVLNIHAYAPNLYTEENVRILSVIASQAAALYKELEALSALASYTDNILRSIAAGVLTLDTDGRVLTWNSAVEDILGVPASRAVGMHFSDLFKELGVSGPGKDRVVTAIESVLTTGEKYLGYKQDFQTVGTGVLYLNVNIAQLRNHASETLGLVIIVEDVTKEVGMENEMHRISELAAVGQLAATVAHELRNPLSSIKGAAQYLKNEYSDHASVCEFLDIIVEEVNVLNKVTTEFLDFARPTKLNLSETDINDVIFRTLQFMHLEIAKHAVELVQELSYDMPRIMADDRLLEQVLRNLVLNSLQAMGHGGTLVVTSQVSDDGVKVKLSDSGVGIPEEQLSQIFVPFFTTKTKGTGLGLAIVRKIIENHGGEISVESRVGEGTAFEIYLPICSDRVRNAMIQADDIAVKGDAGMLRRAQPGVTDFTSF